MSDLGSLDEKTTPESDDQIYIGRDIDGANEKDMRMQLSNLFGSAEGIPDPVTLKEQSSDPDEPAEGVAVIWLSDGTGKGDDGDVMIAVKAGGTTKYGTLFDHSGGSAW